MSLLTSVVLTALVLGVIVRLALSRLHQSHLFKKDVDQADVPYPEFNFDKAPITPLPNFDAATTPPHPYRPWSSGKFTMTMGIAKIKQEEWLSIDSRYCKEQEFRRSLLREHREGVLQLLPGSEAACVEALEFVVSFLTRRYPHFFYSPEGKPDYIHNSLTSKTFRIHEPFDIPPLEVAAQLTMEDLNLLIQGFGDDPEQHYLAASFSMAPAGWHLEERIGWPLWRIHAPVPLWEEKLRRVIEKSFLRMRPDSLICRHNFFMQTNDVLFQQEPFVTDMNSKPRVEDIRLRHERQTLRRLPRSKAIMFTVRTYMTPLLELKDEPDSIRELLGAVQEMHPQMAKYKGRDIWGEVVEAWCKEELAAAEKVNGDA